MNKPAIQSDADTIAYARDMFGKLGVAREMLAMLRELEWIDMDHILYCPRCGQASPDGHDPDCKLSALIRKAEGSTR